MPRQTDLAGLEAALALAASKVGRQRKALEREALKVQQSARGFVGQHEAMKPKAEGPFPAWPDLAPATRADKARKGLPASEMLKRSGALRSSIGKTVTDEGFVVGSDSPYAAAQEFGTSRIPARSFLGRAMHRHAREAARSVGAAAARTVAGQDP